MSELLTKEAKSIERLKAFEPPEGYYLAFSGGKDSVVCKALMEIAGVKYDAHYRVTSVDPPELVRFIRDKHPDVEREVPRDDNGKPITMWNLIPRKLMPPTRLVRYCCSDLKEDGGDGRMTVTGVRWAESVNRAKNQGPVTIPVKAARKSFADDPNFQSTNRGGGAGQRQRGLPPHDRELLQAAQNHGQSYHRMDRCRCVELHPRSWHSLL